MIIASIRRIASRSVESGTCFRCACPTTSVLFRRRRISATSVTGRVSPDADRAQPCGRRLSMEYVAYLRAEAARYRRSAERQDEPDAAKEFDELAVVCERVASEVEDRLTAG